MCRHITSPLVNQMATSRGVGTIFCMGGGLFISMLYYISYNVLLI